MINRRYVDLTDSQRTWFYLTEIRLTLSQKSLFQWLKTCIVREFIKKWYWSCRSEESSTTAEVWRLSSVLSRRETKKIFEMIRYLTNTLSSSSVSVSKIWTSLLNYCFEVMHSVMEIFSIMRFLYELHLSYRKYIRFTFMMTHDVLLRAGLFDYVRRTTWSI